MISCRYVGGDCSFLGEREFEAVGQRAMLSEDGYRDAVLGGAAFIPESDFFKIGFTTEELAANGPVGIRVDPPQAFNEKLARAQQVFRDISSRMLQEAGGLSVLADLSDRDAGELTQ